MWCSPGVSLGQIQKAPRDHGGYQYRAGYDATRELRVVHSPKWGIFPMYPGGAARDDGGDY
jgi:hypothetical protein